MDTVSGVGVLDKSVAVLSALAEHGSSSLAELVAHTRLSRPTTHRLALALEHHGLVGRDEDGRFRLGPTLLAWGARAGGASLLVEAAQLVLAELCDRTGESAQLYVRDGDRRVCIATAERPSGLRDTVPVGSVLPLTAGSGAKVLLAWSSDGARFHTVSPEELEKVRRRGWASSVGERESGVASVSAPVLDDDGRILGAISVSGPAERVGHRPERTLAPRVVAAARRLERGLS